MQIIIKEIIDKEFAGLKLPDEIREKIIRECNLLEGNKEDLKTMYTLIAKLYKRIFLDEAREKLRQEVLALEEEIDPLKLWGRRIEKRY